MAATDFVSNLAAIITACAGLLFELWKAKLNFPMFVEVAQLCFIVVVLGTITVFARVNWLGDHEITYEKRVGYFLKRTVIVLALTLTLFPAGESFALWLSRAFSHR